MQRHKKWLIITIWISTIAFIGAGFVGWGQYSYGDKAGSVAKVGAIEISQGELQKEYANLYAQYNKVFQGNFDAEKAKQFGLQKQALQQLVQKALILNLAHSYDLTVSDKELYKAIKSQEVFYKNGLFDKETYKQVLSQNRLTIKEYEAQLRKELLIQKTFQLLPVEVSDNEKNILNTLLNIADKINYKLLTRDDVTVTVDDAKLQEFWKMMADNFKTEVIYEVKYIVQKPLHNSYDDAKITQYYNEHKPHFKDTDGKILPLEKAKPLVIKELNAKATKDKALRSYIAYKKGKLDTNTQVFDAKVSLSNNPFNEDAYKKIASLSTAAPYAKPIQINNTYYTFELVKIVPSKNKTFADAKAEVTPLYIKQTKEKKLLEIAKNTYKNFQGITTDFITLNDSDKLTVLSQQEAAEFLQKLFTSDKKNSFITLQSGKIVLYNILEQKLLTKTNNNSDTIAQIKRALFNEGLIQTLQNKYQTEIYIKGL